MSGGLLFATYDIGLFGMGVFEAILVAAFWSVWLAVGGYVAKQKRRNIKEGILLGCLGPIGCLIEALLPTNPAT